MTLGDIMKIERDERRFDFHDIGPVSYTHLDVYKRQEFPHLLNHLAVNKRLHALRGQRTGSFAALIAVSYTHLDVYKRQISTRYPPLLKWWSIFMIWDTKLLVILWRSVRQIQLRLLKLLILSLIHI